jgi:hypothetical protein
MVGCTHWEPVLSGIMRGAAVSVKGGFWHHGVIVKDLELVLETVFL